MSFEAFLTFLFNHNILIIQVLFFFVLTLTLGLGLKAVLFPKSGGKEVSLGASAASGSALSNNEIAKIEELIKEAVELKKSALVSEAGSHSELEKAYQAAQVEIKKLKESLAQKNQEIKKMIHSASGSSATSSDSDSGAAELLEKIRNLEAKLAEYEIISEDIADLSKYKQENEKLKKTIEELSSRKPVASDPDDPNDPPLVGKSNFTKESSEEPDGKTPAPTLEAVSSSEAVDDELMKEFAAAVEEQKSAKNSPAQDEASQDVTALAGEANLDALASEAEGLMAVVDQVVAEGNSSLEGELDTDKLAAEAKVMVSEEDKKLMEDFKEVVATKVALLIAMGALFAFCLGLPFDSVAAPSALVPNAEEVLSLPKANRDQVLSKLDPKVLLSDLRLIAFDTRKPFQLRWQALHTLVQLSPKETRADLTRALRSPEWFMRSVGLQALKEHFPKDFYQEAIKALNDPAMMVRSNAVLALESHLDLATRERLWAEYFHPRNLRRGKSLPIREQIVYALSRDPYDTEVDFWRRVQAEYKVGEASPVVAQAAELALKKLAARGSLEPLQLSPVNSPVSSPVSRAPSTLNRGRIKGHGHAQGGAGLN